MNEGINDYFPLIVHVVLICKNVNLGILVQINKKLLYVPFMIVLLDYKTVHTQIKKGMLL